MDFNATVDLIIRELNEAVEIIEDMKNYKDVPSLQVELAKSKCRNAAEVIRLLKNVQEKENYAKQETSAATIREKPDTGKNVITGKPEKAEKKTEVRQTEPQVIKVIEPELPVIKTRQPEPSVIKTRQPATSKKSPGTITIADSFSPRTDSINEQLGVRKDEDGMSEIIKSKPITRLSDAIGINDKFLFIRELFNGNSEMYNNAISSLDNSSSFEDARAMIMDYAGNDDKNEAARQLIDLVKRKFPADE